MSFDIYNMKSVFIYIVIIFEVYDSVHHVNCFSEDMVHFKHFFFVFFAIC